MNNLPAIPDNSAPLTGRVSFIYAGDSYTIENNRLYNADHEVAVVYSPGYGGGWTTWNYGVDPTDARVAILTLTGAPAKLTFKKYDEDTEIRFRDRKFYVYLGFDTSNDLDIEWLPAGTLYKIDEYDGYESVVTNRDMKWNIA